MTLLDRHDAFAEYAAAPSHCVFASGPANDVPLVSITIPTFRRPELLVAAIDSAAAQIGDISFEVVVVDNDDACDQSEAMQRIAAARPGLRLRYFRNAANIGMFGNWNRCIELARGEWVTILNDDDTLRPQFLEQTLALIARRGGIDGIVAHTVLIDSRAGAAAREAAPPSLAVRFWRRIEVHRYDRDGLCRVSPRALFFGNELGNGLAFIFRRSAAIALGGYRPCDWPSSDYYFYVRFCTAYRLFLLRDVLGEVGIGENESMRPEVLKGFIARDHALRLALAEEHVPRHWAKFSPLLVATWLEETNLFWGTAITRDEVARELGIVLPQPSKLRARLLRIIHCAF